MALLLAFALAIAFVAQLAMLRALPYSKASLKAISAQQALSTANPLALGELQWHPAPYLGAASLAPIRTVVRAHCAGVSGFDTAICLSNLFARAFPHGNPQREFLDPSVDPVSLFAAHMQGQPGHCVTRSGMLAAALLSVGIPARVAQFLTYDRTRGHTVAEVWDGKQWRIIDASFAGFVQTADGASSAIAIVQPGAQSSWRSARRLMEVPLLDPAMAASIYREHQVRGSTVVYPEPWLYTRVGQKRAWPPHTGRFVMVGTVTLGLGLGQPILQLGILLSALGVLGIVAWVGARMLAVRRLQRAERPHYARV